MSTTTSTSSDSTEVVTLALEAYQTAVFHALKHEHCVVSGLLLGTATPAGWTVARAVPLFHSAVPLAAMSEAALALVAAAAAPADERPVGVYWASDLVLPRDTSDVTPAGVTALADTLAADAPALVVELDSRALSAVPHVLAARATTRTAADAPWTRCHVAHAPDTAAAVESALTAPDAVAAVAATVDLDEHLEDPQLPWPRL